jgi:hypothetical protein
MNAARIAVVIAGLAAFVAYALSQDDPSVAMLGLGLPVALALEGYWRLLDPKR